MANLIEIGKSGIKVPFLGMGTWAIGGGSWWGDNDDELSVKTIQRAIDLGIKWIDTAASYGLYPVSYTHLDVYKRQVVE